MTRALAALLFAHSIGVPTERWQRRGFLLAVINGEDDLANRILFPRGES